jgi:[ribosomal protein S18]-alanine N-acetyltransferase
MNESSGPEVEAQNLPPHDIHPKDALPAQAARREGAEQWYNAGDVRYTIRSMEGRDLETVEALDQMSFSMPWPHRAYAYELNENPMSLLWVAEAEFNGGERRVVGMVVVWLVLDEAHIATLAVHPDLRGRGIAARLLKTALSGAIEHNMIIATLEVRIGNHTAQHLYQRFHFEIAGRRVRYYRDNNEDALIMTVEGLGPAYLAWLEKDGWQSGGAL